MSFQLNLTNHPIIGIGKVQERKLKEDFQHPLLTLKE